MIHIARRHHMWICTRDRHSWPPFPLRSVSPPHRYRWMTIHDSQTTTIQEGWRVDGCAGKTESVGKKELQKNKTKADVLDFMAGRYMDLVVPEGGVARYKIASGFRDKLKAMRSDFEVGGSSQMMVHGNIIVVYEDLL